MSPQEVTVELTRELINSKIALEPYPTDQDIEKATLFLQRQNDTVQWYEQIQINTSEGYIPAFSLSGSPIWFF